MGDFVWWAGPSWFYRFDQFRIVALCLVYWRESKVTCRHIQISSISAVWWNVWADLRSPFYVLPRKLRFRKSTKSNECEATWCEDSPSFTSRTSVLDRRFPRRWLWNGTTLSGPCIQLWDPRGTQILEPSIRNSKFRLWQFIYFSCWCSFL
jgi:hypothetical protein